MSQDDFLSARGAAPLNNLSVTPIFDHVLRKHPLRRFERGAADTLVVVVDPSFPVRSLSAFIAYAKANSGRINMASSGKDRRSGVDTRSEPGFLAVVDTEVRRRGLNAYRF